MGITDAEAIRLQVEKLDGITSRLRTTLDPVGQSDAYDMVEKAIDMIEEATCELERAAKRVDA